MFKTSSKQFLLIIAIMLISGAAQAATTGGAFEAVYDFFYEAATGYLGRAIAIVGGLIGLGIGAGSGKALPAVIGVILAIFGALGPQIINTIFNSAVLY